MYPSKAEMGIMDKVFLRITNKSLSMGGKRKTEHKKAQAARVLKGTDFT